jgi:hypothetical protein
MGWCNLAHTKMKYENSRMHFARLSMLVSKQSFDLSLVKDRNVAVYRLIFSCHFCAFLIKTHKYVCIYITKSAIVVVVQYPGIILLTILYNYYISDLD